MSTSTGPAIRVDNVAKTFRMYRERNQSLKAAVMRRRRAKFEKFWALQNVSFDIARGSTFGIIGDNGSGKSTLLKCIARILEPDTGNIIVDGSMAALLELGSGFHPELSGRENIFLNGSILGLRMSEIEAKLERIIDFAGVRQFIDQPVKNYSSGMYVRLGFSVAINVDPDILLVDEVLAVGDANFQDKCMEKFAEFRRSGKTVVLVSHGMGSIRSMCDEAAWLQRGQLLGVGEATRIVDSYVDGTHVTEVVAMPDGSTRWGTGEIRVSRVELLGCDGTPANSFHTDDELTMRIHYDARMPVERPVFGLTLETIAGVCAWSHHSRDGRFVPDVVQGAGSVDLHIPKLKLQAGTFELHASITDYTTTHTFDFRNRIARLNVLSATPHESGGVASLGGTWGNLCAESADRTQDGVLNARGRILTDRLTSRLENGLEDSPPTP